MKVTCEELIPNGKLSGRLSLSTFSYPHDLHTESNMTRNGSRVTCFCYCDSRIFSYPKLSSSAEFWKPSLFNPLSLRFLSLLPDFNLFFCSRRPFLLVQTSTQKSLSSPSVLFSAVTSLPYPPLFQFHLAVWFSCAVALYPRLSPIQPSEKISFRAPKTLPDSLLLTFCFLQSSSDFILRN